MEGTEEKRQKLAEMMDKLAGEDIMVAFSGGVDSSLLLKAACDSAGRTGKKVYAVTIQTALHPTEDIEVAGRVAKEMGAVHVILSVDELAEAGIEDNPVTIFGQQIGDLTPKKAQELGVPVIVEGTNADDLTVYRPGIRAIRELGITSPLALLGITKEEVRKFAGEYGISVSNRPSAPCLATRFPYGTRLNMDKMKQVDQGVCMGRLPESKWTKRTCRRYWHTEKIWFPDWKRWAFCMLHLTWRDSVRAAWIRALMRKRLNTDCDSPVPG